MNRAIRISARPRNRSSRRNRAKSVCTKGNMWHITITKVKACNKHRMVSCIKRIRSRNFFLQFSCKRNKRAGLLLTVNRVTSRVLICSNSGSAVQNIFLRINARVSSPSVMNARTSVSGHAFKLNFQPREHSRFPGTTGFFYSGKIRARNKRSFERGKSQK